MELKPCPFCGGEARCEPFVCLGFTSYYVGCKECDASTHHFDRKKEAIMAWNRRVNDGTERKAD